MTGLAEEVKLQAHERILTTAEEVFGEKGFAAARMSDIARRAEVNQALIHYYFQSKEKLYQEVLLRLFHRWQVHVNSMGWHKDEPEAELRKYIRAHFQFQCRYPNLYKIFQWELLGSSGILKDYVAEFWIKDMQDRLQIIHRWKQLGKVNERIGGKTFLFMMWGIMHQFYYRNREELADVVGYDDELEALQAEIVEQITEFILYGFIKRSPTEGDEQPLPDNKRSSDSPMIRLLADDASGETAKLLMQQLRKVHHPEAVFLTDLASIGNERLDGAYLFAIHTEYGEMPDIIYRFLNILNNHMNCTNVVVGIWTTGPEPAVLHLQRVIEDEVNLAGAFALSRPLGETLERYMERFIRLASSIPDRSIKNFG